VAIDRIESIYHLTRNGWVDGSVDSMWTAQNTTVEPPADRVESWRHKLYQSSGWSGEENSFVMIWHDPTVSAEEREALHVKYPHPEDK
jgi:hypothetical protein